MRPLLISGLLIAACSRREASADASADVAPESVAASTSASAEPPDPLRDTMRAVLDAKTLAAAMSNAKPLFATDDVQPQGASTGSLAIAYWAAQNLKWSDVDVTKDETSWPMAQKDIGDARGKRLCRTGTVGEIKALHGPRQTKFFNAFLHADDGVFATLAAGSTGAIVKGSRARFCGVVTGLSAVDSARYVDAVGLFDLPENRQR